MESDYSMLIMSVINDIVFKNDRGYSRIKTAAYYGKPFYYLLSKLDILYIISDILYRI